MHFECFPKTDVKKASEPFLQWSQNESLGPCGRKYQKWAFFLSYIYFFSSSVFRRDIAALQDSSNAGFLKQLGNAMGEKEKKKKAKRWLRLGLPPQVGEDLSPDFQHLATLLPLMLLSFLLFLFFASHLYVSCYFFWRITIIEIFLYCICFSIYFLWYISVKRYACPSSFFFFKKVPNIRHLLCIVYFFSSKKAPKSK